MRLNESVKNLNHKVGFLKNQILCKNMKRMESDLSQGKDFNLIEFINLNLNVNIKFLNF
jgi:hypothetical protein